MKKKGNLISFFLIVIIAGAVIGLTTSKITKDINLGLDLQGGFEVLFEVEPVDQDQEVTRTLMEAAVQRLNDRVNRLGISETNIDIEGTDRIRVQVAGIEDSAEARDMLATSARLSFRDVNDVELMDGTHIKEGSARQDFDPTTNQPVVTLELKDPSYFAEITSELASKRPRQNEYIPIHERENLLVIWMDYEEGDSFKEEIFKEEPKFISAPEVNETLTQSTVVISGSFSIESAQYLANILNAGSLPVNMTELYSTTVGAQFGEQALEKTVFAGIIAIALIVLFMCIVYRFTGIIVSINLLIYVFLILLVFKLMNGVLTLPGIAALILGVAMAVDANILTFERIKEELRKGKSVVAAFKSGSKNALGTIIDANLTTLIVATVLFYFGTSSVKGFATMLIVSILLSFITAVYGTRLLLGLWVHSGYLHQKFSWFGVKEESIRDIADDSEEETLLFKRRVNFVGLKKRAFRITLIVFLIGIISLVTLRLNPGVDFTSGTRIDLTSDEPLTQEQIEDDLATFDLNPQKIVLSGEDGTTATVRFDIILDEETEAAVSNYLYEAYGETPSISVVSPIVGEELVKNALKAVAFASIVLIIYVSIRFEFYFAITAIIGLLHDVIIMLFALSLTRIEFDSTMIAALLTIIGYSLNNTIVVFDRIRENVRKEQKVYSAEKLKNIISRSLAQTFTRNINTVGTTILAVLAFMLLGAESIFGFSFAILVGLLAGTYSSLFLVAQLWYLFRSKNIKERPVDFTKRKRVEGPQV